MKKLILFWCIIATGSCNIAAMKKHTSMKYPHIGHCLYENSKYKGQSFALQQVKKMLKAGVKIDVLCDNPKCRDPLRCHPLLAAMSFPDASILELLLTHYKKPNLKFNFMRGDQLHNTQSLLEFSLARSLDKTKAVLEKGANPNDGMSLFRLIDGFRFSQLALLFAYGASPEDKHYKTKKSFLNVALENRPGRGTHPSRRRPHYFFRLTELISKGLKLTWKDIKTKKRQPRYIVSCFHKRGLLDIEELQTRRNFDPNIPCDTAGLTLLHYAIIYVEHGYAKKLIELGADPLKKCCYGLSPYDMYLQLKPTLQEQENNRFEILLNPPECPICLELIRVYTFQSYPCCKQKFHKTCAKEWHQTQKQRGVKKTCPYCGTEL